MVGLDERFQRHLPVDRENDGLVRADAAVLPFIDIELFGQRRQELVQRLTLRIHVDPDKTGPGTALHLGNAQLRLAEIRAALPIVFLEDGDHLAFQVEIPGVVAAEEGLHPALVVIPQLPPPVRADIVKRANAVGSIAHDENGFVADLIVDVVPHLGNFLLAAGDLPHSGPQQFHFLAVKRRGVIGGRHIVPANGLPGVG